MALFQSRGRICEMSEVQSGTGKNGYQWHRMFIVLEIPGHQGSVTKQCFHVNGESCDDVLEFKVGDKVEVSFTMYAREWNGKWYNNVDLVKIKSQVDARQDAPAAPAPQQEQIQFNRPDNLNPSENPDDLPF